MSCSRRMYRIFAAARIKKNPHVIGRCGYGCENRGSFAVARQQYQISGYRFWEGEAKPVLVLNFANPVHPGGGVRRGARAATGSHRR